MSDPSPAIPRVSMAPRSLDASGVSLFLNLICPAMLDLILK